MQSGTKNTLLEISNQLDRNQFPLVYNGGIVMPSYSAVIPLPLGKETNYEKRRSTTRSRQRPTPRQRQTYQSWETRKTAPIICSNLRTKYEAELDALQEAYPDTKIWQEAEGMWLLCQSQLIKGLGKKATFLSAIPYSLDMSPRSWGFWTTDIYADWIGPRHTNFPDGSICAFEPKDMTWTHSDSLIDLIDIYSVWALRHESLNTFGRWPGYQSVDHPYERILELRDDEYCGCYESKNLYVECCKTNDHLENCLASAIHFWIHYSQCKPRTPPEGVTNCIRGQVRPPKITGVF